VAARFGDAAEPEIRVPVSVSMYNKASVLEETGRFAETVAAAEFLIDRFGTDTADEVRRQVARGRHIKARALAELGEGERSARAWDDFLDYADGDVISDKMVAEAVLRKGESLARQRRAVAAFELYRVIVMRFIDDPAPVMRLIVSGALCQSGYCLEWLGRIDEARRTYSGLLAAYDPAEDDAIKSSVEYARKHLDALPPS
jgi:tetratricopeptide (TPR) repeat protein